MLDACEISPQLCFILRTFSFGGMLRSLETCRESQSDICVTCFIQELPSSVCLTKKPGWAKGQGKIIL